MRKVRKEASAECEGVAIKETKANHPEKRVEKGMMKEEKRERVEWVYRRSCCSFQSF